MKRTCGLVAALTILGAPGIAWADNTTAANAYSLMVGGPASEATVTFGTVSRWYVVGTLQPHRSYCAHTQAGDRDTSATAGNTDTLLTIFESDATQVKVANDDAVGDPPGWALSRACFITGDNTERVYVRVSAQLAGATFNVRTQVVDTTLFSNWFFVGGDYAAFTLIRNTTNAVLNYGIRWRNAAGTVVANTSGTLPANGSVSLNARSFAGAVTAVAGTVDIVHNGAPDSIVASNTVLSTTTGLSFDAPFIRRQTW